MLQLKSAVVVGWTPHYNYEGGSESGGGGGGGGGGIRAARLTNVALSAMTINT